VSSANGRQTENQPTLSKAYLEELMKRDAPSSPVLSVFLDTDQSRVRGLAAESRQEYGNIGAFFAVVNASA
jgi:hypothetical protein